MGLEIQNGILVCRRLKSNEIIMERNIIKRDEENGG